MMNKKVKSLDDNILFGVLGAGRSDDRENPTESSQKRKQLMATGRSALPAILPFQKLTTNTGRPKRCCFFFFVACNWVWCRSVGTVGFFLVPVQNSLAGIRRNPNKRFSKICSMVDWFFEKTADASDGVQTMGRECVV
jgi:hypothetical protein